MGKTNRNDPCPCGSGKKYKKCCYKQDQNKKTQGGFFRGIKGHVATERTKKMMKNATVLNKGANSKASAVFKRPKKPEKSGS